MSTCLSTTVFLYDAAFGQFHDLSKCCLFPRKK